MFCSAKRKMHFACPYKRPRVVLPHCSRYIIIGWDFLAASQLVIDSGQNERFPGDVFQDHATLDSRKLYATKDCTLKTHSLTKIAVSGGQSQRSINVVIDGNEHLLIEKNIAVPSMITSYHNGQSEIWITNLQSGNQIICGNYWWNLVMYRKLTVGKTSKFRF
ncbi:transposon Ty3-I Gag-Pol polyprotein [Trichonephila clavata]|uniref:Transposon Ty3-I Gag-Pol polyprotein n=1 Tax=Trichonephila clavata TaxID=2740835 RepID=A0A8X6K6G3_TRICU|nr:transposon Ty3-I Gag-Pol polyprotein [Trichonephila clavata]